MKDPMNYLEISFGHFIEVDEGVQNEFDVSKKNEVQYQLINRLQRVIFLLFSL